MADLREVINFELDMYAADSVQKALKAVAELHEKREGAMAYCSECSLIGYPCATLRTIAEKLGVDRG